MLLGLRSRWRGFFVQWLAYGANKPTTRQTSHADDFVNAKSHAREKPQGNACGSMLVIKKGFLGELPLLISCYNSILEDESKQKASIVGNGRC